jgi:hypothetical protein
VNQCDRDFLTAETVQNIIEKYILVPPAVVARQLYKSFGSQAALIARQIDGLQRAKGKLPAFYQARCLLPPEMVAQASSEKIIRLRLPQGGNTNTAVDLTIGLGADLVGLSSVFTQVIGCEIHPERYQLARHNLYHQLKIATPLDLLHQSAEDYLLAAEKQKQKIDYLFIDPDRRSNTNQLRTFHPAAARPNVLAFFDTCLKISSRGAIKLSPMLDINQTMQWFKHANQFTILSVNNECKEVLVEWDENMINNQKRRALWIRNQQAGVFSPLINYPPLPYKKPTVGRFIYEPDVSLYCSGLAESYVQACFSGNWFRTGSPGYLISDTAAETFAGRRFIIEEILPYKTNHIKNALLNKGILAIEMSKQDFPLSISEIRKKLAIPDGSASGYCLLFTGNFSAGITVILAKKW